MNALALCLLSIVPVETTIVDHVDVAELNHFYDYDGRLVFDQVIYYDWCQHHERYQVVAWRLVKFDTSQSPHEPIKAFIPQRDWEGGGYAATWVEGDCIRRVRADSFRETWLQYDPELSEREIYPKEKRRELRKAEVTK